MREPLPDGWKYVTVDTATMAEVRSLEMSLGFLLDDLDTFNETVAELKTLIGALRLKVAAMEAAAAKQATQP